MGSLELFLRSHDRLDLQYFASAAPADIVAVFDVIYDNGQVGELRGFANSFAIDRSGQNEEGSIMERAGRVVGGRIGGGGGVKRGQFHISANIFRGTTAVAMLCQGYLHDSNNLPLGFYEGMRDGPGFRSWVTVADNSPGNTDLAAVLTASNAHRRLHGILVKYHCASDADNRTIDLTIRDIFTAAGSPTGFSIAGTIYEAPSLGVLTANQEGIIFVGARGFVALNTAGTVTYASRTTAPHPLPFDIAEGDTADVVLTMTSGHANDRYDVYLDIEEWLER